MAGATRPAVIASTDGHVNDQPSPASKSRWPSPLTRRRWANFKANRRGYSSLWIISTLIVLTLFAEFIANDKPLLMGYKGDLYAPVLFFYPETEFGGVFETEAVYASHRVQEMIGAGDGWMVWPPIPFSHDTIDFHIEGVAPEAPSLRHWLGTDDVARDVTARIIYGFRLSVLFGIGLTFLSAVIGIAVGRPKAISAA